MSSTIDWPSTLPSFPLTKWSYTHNVPVTVSEMEIGPPKIRLRETTDSRTINGTIVLDESQIEIFRDFVITTLSRGVYTFNWPDFITGVSIEVGLLLRTNGQLYSIKQTGDHTYEIGITLEVQP